MKSVESDAVYIYQMGKVGSFTVLETLGNMGMDLFHEHCFTLSHYEAVGIKRVLGTYADITSKFSAVKRKIYPSQRLREFQKRPRIKLITLVREPISRNLSLCFHHFTDFIRDDVTRRTFKEHSSSFEMFSHYLENKINQSAGIHWFDLEFQPTTGVDVYDFPFDREKGYNVIHSGKYDILVMQVEQLNTSMEMIRAFLGLPDPLVPVQRNIGSRKWYHLLYNEFKENYVPSPSLVDALYTSKFMTHFYSEADIAKFRQKWDKK